MDLNAINEEWFLGQLEAAEIDASGLVSVFTEMDKADRGEEAAGWGQILFQKVWMIFKQIDDWG